MGVRGVGARLLELAATTIERQALAHSYAAASIGLCTVRTDPASFGVATIALEDDIWRSISRLQGSSRTLRRQRSA
jgi:hypothetical protein